MQIKLLKEIVGSIAGANATNLVDLLFGKKNVNEFIIAKKLNLNINQTRNILYKLTDAGLVSFIRKKDKKNGGWYTYYWTLDATKSLISLKTVISNDIQQLETQLGNRQKERFYYSPNCDLEVDEENALLNNFICPECGEVLVLRDNAALITSIQSNLVKRNEQLALVAKELGDRHQKEDSLRQRRIKAEAKRRSVERMRKRKAKQDEKKKSLKAKPQKPASKKSARSKGKR